MPAIRQSSFAGGEISSDLQGRHDLARYGISLKTCRNFFISKRGSAVSRPGTTYVAEVRNNHGVDNAVRLVPFVFSDAQALCLEFGDSSAAKDGTDAYMRVIKDGALVGGPFVLDLSGIGYTVAQLPYLKFTQVGNAIYITHQSHRPQVLTRNDSTNTNWTIADFAFGTRDMHESGSNYVSVGSKTYPPSPTTYSAATTYALGDQVKLGGNSYVSLQAANVGHSVGDLSWWMQDNTLLGRPWQWAVTALVQDNNGLLWETDISEFDPGAGVQVPLSPSHPVSFVTSDGGGVAAQGAGWKLWGAKAYRGIGGVYGLVGVQNTLGTFIDDGVEPDYTQPPPQFAYNPFKLQSPGNGATFYSPRQLPTTTTDFPATVAVFEQRMCFGNTPSRPSTLFMSFTDNYYRFDDVILPTAASAMQWTLASRMLADIRSLVSAQELLAFTGSGVWAISGNGGPLAFDSINCKVQTEMGASWLTPLIVEDACLYTRAKGTGVRQLVKDFRVQKFAVSDLSTYAEHLFINHQVVDWAYAEDPWGLIYAVRDDGVLLTCTYSREQELLAWARHDTRGADTYENVCAVPNGTVDDVYFVVKRTINGTTKRYIERGSSRIVTPTTDMTQVNCLDCAKVISMSGTAVSGLSHLEACTVWCLVDGSVQGPFTVASGAITLSEAATATVIAGLPYVPQMEGLRPVLPGAEVSSRVKTLAQASVEVDNSKGLAVGQTLTALSEWQQREVANSYSAIPGATKQVTIYPQNDWDQDGGIAVQQNWPLPLTVTAWVREVEFGDW